MVTLDLGCSLENGEPVLNFTLNGLSASEHAAVLDAFKNSHGRISDDGKKGFFGFLDQSPRSVRGVFWDPDQSRRFISALKAQDVQFDKPEELETGIATVEKSFDEAKQEAEKRRIGVMVHANVESASGVPVVRYRLTDLAPDAAMEAAAVCKQHSGGMPVTIDGDTVSASTSDPAELLAVMQHLQRNHVGINPSSAINAVESVRGHFGAAAGRDGAAVSASR